MPAHYLKFFQHHQRIETDAALTSAAHYIAAMESSLPAIEKTEREELQHLFDNPSEEEGYLDHEEFEQYQNEINERIVQNYTPALRYSFVVFLHTLFETQLVRVCNVLREEKKLPISVNDLRGSAIDQAKIYLSNIVGLNVADLDEWTALQDFQKVRDCVTHNNGKVIGSRHEKRLRQIQLAGYSIKDESIQLTEAFPAAHHSFIYFFFRKLFTLLDWKAQWKTGPLGDIRYTDN